MSSIKVISINMGSRDSFIDPISSVHFWCQSSTHLLKLQNRNVELWEIDSNSWSTKRRPEARHSCNIGTSQSNRKAQLESIALLPTPFDNLTETVLQLNKLFLLTARHILQTLHLLHSIIDDHSLYKCLYFQALFSVFHFHASEKVVLYWQWNLFVRQHAGFFSSLLHIVQRSWTIWEEENKWKMRKMKHYRAQKQQTRLLQMFFKNMTFIFCNPCV